MGAGTPPPGVTVARAQAALDLVMSRLAGEFPVSNAGRGARVVAANDVRFHPAVDGVLQPVAGLLLAVVALVLAIACSNLANLLLASAARRQREVAIRLALGARRARLVRQLLVESVLIGLAGGAIGLVLAFGRCARSPTSSRRFRSRSRSTSRSTERCWASPSDCRW